MNFCFKAFTFFFSTFKKYLTENKRIWNFFFWGFLPLFWMSRDKDISYFCRSLNGYDWVNTSFKIYMLMKRPQKITAVFQIRIKWWWKVIIWGTMGIPRYFTIHLQVNIYNTNYVYGRRLSIRQTWLEAIFHHTSSWMIKFNAVIIRGIVNSLLEIF